jgi:DNA-binding CsgD family transcriptional regulator
VANILGLTLKMDNLIKDEHGLMPHSGESFPTQLYAQAYEETVHAGVPLDVSAPAILPMVQTYRIPAGNISPASLLTIRETDILESLGKGLSVKGAARGLAISPGTVKWHVKNLYRKLGASSREDALHKARLLHLIR